VKAGLAAGIYDVSSRYGWVYIRMTRYEMTLSLREYTIDWLGSFPVVGLHRGFIKALAI
jgi:hypothetical protein